MSRQNPMTDEDMSDPVKRAAYIARLTEEEAETEEDKKDRLAAEKVKAKERACIAHKLGPFAKCPTSRFRSSGTQRTLTRRIRIEASRGGSEWRQEGGHLSWPRSIRSDR